MNARKKLSVSLKKQVAEFYKEEYKKAARISAYRMTLIFLYALRFDFHFKKRLNTLFDAISENNKNVDVWKKSDVMASVMVQRLEDSGCFFNGAFDELIEYEEKEYKKNSAEEIEKREAGK